MNTVKTKQDGSVLRVIIDHPPVNALDVATQEALIAAFERVSGQEDVSVVVLTGAGSAYCGGVDLHALGEELDSVQRRLRDELMLRVYTSLDEIPAVTICQIRGYGVGAGYVMASLCDFRVMADDAFVQLPEIDRGTVAAGGAYLHRLGISGGDLRRLLLLGERIAAPEALAMGLVDRVAPADRLDELVAELAGQLAAKSPLALRLVKEAIVTAEAHTNWQAGYRATLPLNARLRTSEDGSEAVRAFLEKRAAAFSSRP